MENSLLSDQAVWEAELDSMGTSCSLSDYVTHLEKAPLPEASMSSYLRGFIAARSQPF